ncbi:UDP-N-acetylmuramate dehydrogenase [Swaminathania salitolerans]|uniref:UDP-N-acetylenolpyruvoylglucosamine reductase n=1 Tax=Swaminathania salitolerans TaxID=182838 RepID=A0A511BPK1_9PROT|nr:UDP-N-acetylmuramate dehydrogenase [Swaminathania salitolerans]GBQ10974.1 UDP-N-acetylenolpyruvoylglucosamine reductase [Swaminathania salitolerans LMG 21291]GEL02251.1 UDP-N-acetylenolpyruvoylglucosamine reductase [Swaminathania salitolerans]
MTGSVAEILRGLTPRGRLGFETPLGPRSWFRTGGPAEALFVPDDAEDLADVLSALPATVPVTMLGACSNVILRDGGVRGLVVRMAGGFSEILIEEDGLVAGASALDMIVAERAAQAGLEGLEFLAGIPGSIGGAVVMNAGAYESDIRTVLDWAEILTPDGAIRRLSNEALGFSYRHATLPAGGIVLRARLHARKGDPATIRAHIARIKTAREAAQPVRARTGGSTFRNPEGYKAWQLVDEAGCRGLRMGDAQVSEKHCNFLLNLGNATSSALEGLGEEVRRRVLEKSGISLQWEIKRLGEPAPALSPTGELA